MCVDYQIKINITRKIVLQLLTGYSHWGVMGDFGGSMGVDWGNPSPTSTIKPYRRTDCNAFLL